MALCVNLPADPIRYSPYVVLGELAVLCALYYGLAVFCGRSAQFSLFPGVDDNVIGLSVLVLDQGFLPVE